MTTKDALALALEALELSSITVDNFTVQAKCQDAITAIKQAQQAQEPVETRSLKLAKQQWEHWKQYALELQERLVKYEGGAPMVLNATHPAPKQAQEPVARVVVKHEGRLTSVDFEWAESVNRLGEGVYPVYLHPAPKQAEPIDAAIGAGEE